MTSLNRTGAVLRITALTAALIGVYGPAVALADPGTLSCDGSSCVANSPFIDQAYLVSNPGSQTWVVKGTNSAVFTLQGGTVTAVGNNARGVLAELGSQVTVNDVKVSANGASGHGVQAFGAGSKLTLNETTITTLSDSYAVAVSAQQGGVVTGKNNTIVTNGEYGSGAEADRGGSISLTGGTITTNGYGAAGARAISGNGSTDRGAITLDGTKITTIRGIGLLAGDEDGAGKPQTAGDITFKNGTVIAQGKEDTVVGAQAGLGSAARVQNGSHLIVENSILSSAERDGVAIRNAGSTAQLTNTTIKTAGTAINSKTNMPSGILAEDKAVVTVQGGSIATTGAAFTRGILATSGAKVQTNGTAISTVGNNSHAVHAWGPDQTSDPTSVNSPEVVVNGGTINTKGSESFGLSAQNGGRVTSSADITTSGQAGFGAFAYNGGQIALNGGSINTSGAIFTSTNDGPVGAFGVLAKKGSTINVADTRITTTGDRAEGLRAEEESDKKGVINATNATIKTSGKLAHGVAAIGANSLVSMTGGSITTTGEGAAGAFLKNNSNVNLNGVKVASAGAALQSSFTNAGKKQTINIGAGSDLTSNNGTLLQVAREGAGADGIVNLNLQAGSFSAGNVSDLDGTNGVKVAKADGAQWAGIVVDKTTKVVADGGSQTYSSDRIEQSVAGGTGSTIVFNNGANIGGSISAGTNSTVTFNGNTQIDQNVVGQQGSRLTFGGPTQISNSVTAVQGSSLAFAGLTVIGTAGSTGNAIAGQGASFVFSQTAPTTINGSVVLGDNSSLKGGTTSAPITITGGTTVNSGATLGGNLFVSGALSGAGGSLRPGNSVGTQSYDTSAGFTGAYVAEVNGAGQSDLIIIRNGNFNLAGVNLTVAEENGNGGYLLNHDYTIVQTVAGDVQNTFGQTNLDTALQNKLVKLDPVKYGQKDVKVSLSADLDKIAGERGNLTANQNATLDGLLSVSSANTLAYAALTSADRQSALNQLSGEGHASTQSALLNSGNLLVRTLSNRMRGNVGAGMLAGAPTAQASGSLPASAMPSSAAYPLWAQVVGSWQEQKGDSNAAKTKTDTAGLFIGGDTQVGAGWRVGGALGFTDGKIKVSDRSSTSDVTSYTAALYGANSWATSKGNKVNFLAGAGYTRHNIDSRRNVNVGGNQTLKADYDANTMQLFTELGYALPVGQASEVEPYVGLAWINQRAKGFSESGGSAALSGNSQTDSVTTFTLGVRGSTVFSAGKRDGKLFAGLGWRNATGDVDASRKLAFIQGNGAEFTVSGAPIAKNAAVLDLGGEMSVGKNTAMGLSYNGQFGNGSTDNTGSLYMKMRF